jgi:hypothetical protein
MALEAEREGKSLFTRPSGRAKSRAPLNSSVRPHMEDLSRSPTKFERFLALFLSALATLIFGGVAVFIWHSASVSYPGFAIFTVLFLISAAMFYRAAFTSRRRLSNGAVSRLGWVLVGGGVVCAVVALVFGSGTLRLLLLGSSLSCIVYGLAGLRHRAQ